MSQDTIFCGSGKTIQTQYGELLKLSMGPKDIQNLYDNRNEKGWINLVVKKRKETGKYGETHSICVDNWKPEKQDQVAEAPVDGGPQTW
jgi:hypothetical protein